MLWLAFWQLDKSRLRQAELDRYAAAIVDQRPRAVTEVTGDDRFAPVAAQGVFVGDRQVLIDNISRRGRNGFFVIAALRLESGELLLVNRGWLAQTPRREPVADVTAPVGAQRVLGRVGRLPVGGLRLGEPQTTITEWPPVLLFPTLPELEQLLDEPLLPWVLLQESDDETGLERRWEPGGLPPERHLGYAVQWFALCIALTLLMAMMWWRMRRDSEQ